ncbi:MAG: hypothetical protein MJZ79_08465 [Paludibacteraceae bacterium]|nr:hypothetical protein [Paludibacteraceae bacterium]
MKKVYLIIVACLLMCAVKMNAQQLPNADFEDWSGSAFDGKEQPKSWNASNVTQVGMKFNFAHKEAGHNGGYCMMVQDQEVGALGITETSPGYFSLGTPWVYLKSVTEVQKATAGTYGGVDWKYRPDTMAVWIRRTGGNVTREDFHLLYYSWIGNSQGNSYKGKNGSCTSVSYTNEESDIRLSTNGNECGTAIKASQVSEGWVYEKKEYANWTLVKVPIFYMDNRAPEKMNIIFSASNYPNFRANSGLYAGNSLYVDDIQLIYSSKIQKLLIDGQVWNGFDPNSQEEQRYSLGKSATAVPSIEAIRGAGSLTNSKGKTASFAGRTLQGDEIQITKGKVGEVTTIVVKAEDGSSTMTYKIRFMQEASNNAYLAGIQWDGMDVKNFSMYTMSYEVELPYGTTEAPTITAIGQESAQKIEITQAKSLTDKATIKVTAADGVSKQTYTVTFKVALLSDNTLQDILVDGSSVPGFIPMQTTYSVSVPLGTSEIPDVKAVSAYPDGEQTIKYIKPESITGQYKIEVTTPGNMTPKTYKLNFKQEASTYSKLKSLSVGGQLVEGFSPDIYTYYISLPMGTTELPAITYEQGDKYQTVTVTEGGLNGTTVVTVVAASGAQSVYKLIFSTEMSDVSELNMIYLDGQPLEGFSPSTRQYTIALPIGTTTLPTITWDVMDEYETVTMTEGGVNGTTRIVVTAGDGSVTTYQLTFSVEQASNADLRMIYIDGDSLEGFDPSITNYTYNLPQGTTELPIVTFTQGDEYQSVKERKPSGLTGDYILTVRAQSGATKTYTITFTLSKSSNTNLQMIYLDGQPLEGFDPEITEYKDTLPMGVTVIPTVTFTKGDATQKVLSVREGTTQKLTVTAESGDKKEYTILFVIQRSESAFLKMIYLNGDSLDDFDSKTYDYEVELTTATCPTITVDKEESQQITIAAPYAAGTAQIVVQPLLGASNTYRIEFVAPIIEDALLNGILLNGVALEGFQPTTMNYTVSCEGALPEITPITKEGQTASVLFNQNIASIFVKAGDYTATYTITFEQQISANAYLNNILIDGTSLAGFAPKTTEYVVNLAAGSELPVVTYVKGHDNQVVYMGQQNDTTVQIVVVAPNGEAKSTYIVAFNIAKYDDATLQNIYLSGVGSDAFMFVPTKYEYNITYENGLPLPDMTILTRERQTTMHFDKDANTQVIIVKAESGRTATYTLHYDRIMSSNARLSAILIDGDTIEGWNSEKFNYVDSLEWRTTTVPSVQPVAGIRGQEITTYFSQVNGTTRIHVKAPNGNEGEYTIAFPVKKSNNVALSNLELDHETLSIEFDPEVTDYEVTLPKGETAIPAILYEKAELEQTISVIFRPLGQTSEITVTAENGDTRTYSILFKAAPITDANVLKKIHVEETNVDLDLTTDATQREFDVALPFGAKTMSVSYEKNYTEQTVFVQPGGVNNPTIITVKANQEGTEDVVYTLNPVVTTLNPATLTGITIDGVELADFNPERFTYVLNRTTTNVPQVNVSKASGVECSPMVDLWSWTGVVTKDGYTNTYKVFFHYPNEVIPNGEFTEWTNQAVAMTHEGIFDSKSKPCTKPASWNAPGDYIDIHLGTAKAGPSVDKKSETVVALVNTYWAALLGTVPAVINLGKMTATFGVDGATNVTPSGSIPYHNTPDMAIMNYKYPDKAGQGALFRYKFTDNNGTEHVIDHKNTSETSSYKDYTQALSLSGLNITGMDIIIASAGQYPIGPKGAGTDCSSELDVDYIRFSYNHNLQALKVNGIDATLTGNAFTVTLEDSENTLVPQLAFTGEVADQAQNVVWSAEVVEGEYGVRHADITNYGEDGQSAAYTLDVKRPLSPIKTLSAINIGGTPLAAFKKDSFYYEVILSADELIKDVYPAPESHLQTITTVWGADSTMTIIVTPEYGEANVYTVKFKVIKSDDTTLSMITGIENFDPHTREYIYIGEQLPEMKFEKNEEHQTVEMNNGVFTVTAEDGSVGTYTVTLQAPEYTTSALLTDLSIEGNLIQGFSSETYNYTTDQTPVWTSFIKEYNRDSVIYTMRNDSMLWRVIGSPEGTEQTYTLFYGTLADDNTNLRMIYINGEPFADFNPEETELSYLTDTTDQIAVEKDEEQQSIEMSLDGNVYTIIVTAPDGTTTATRHLTINRKLSAENRLSDLQLDGVTIDGFAPDSLSYVITIPVGAYKTEQPQLPDITYTLMQKNEQVEISEGRLGEVTELYVKAENGINQNTYSVLIQAEPSHNASLSGIMVNGVLVDRFEQGRHYYSVLLSSKDEEVTYTTEDNFQTITQSHNGNIYTIHVVAEDGVTMSDYEVEIFREHENNDAQLQNILLDGADMSDYNPSMNPTLIFDPANNTYSIKLPTKDAVLPEVSAQLKMEGQKVNVVNEGNVIKLVVTAMDGVSTNTYTLTFEQPNKSFNANLDMIYLDGDSINKYGVTFAPTNYYYLVKLPVGTTKLSEVAVQKAEDEQTYNIKQDGNRVNITVTAEDGHSQSTYTLVFDIQLSSNKNLAMIFLDGDSLQGFDPAVYNYQLNLPVGTQSFPHVTWYTGDESQMATLDTVSMDALRAIEQIHVTAGDGSSSVYTLNMDVMRSDVDTLRNIFVDDKPLADFDAHQFEYSYTLAAGTTELPKVDYEKGDQYQTVKVDTLIESTVSYKTFGQKLQITAIAQSGSSNSYVLHFPMMLSDNTELFMIMLNGEVLPGFVKELRNYTVQMPYREGSHELPIITVQTAETAQTYDIILSDDTVRINVTAENGAVGTYTLVFNFTESPYALLDSIKVNGEMIAGFNPELTEYYDTLFVDSPLPAVDFVANNDKQMLDITTSDIMDADNHRVFTYLCSVTSADGSNFQDYSVQFCFAKTQRDTAYSSNRLLEIKLNGELIDIAHGFNYDFNPDTLHYTYAAYPIGSNDDVYFDKTAISYTLETPDPVAGVRVDTIDNAIIVDAETGRCVAREIKLIVFNKDNVERTYTIKQSIALSTDSTVTRVYINGETFMDFDPAIHNYTYYYKKGTSMGVSYEAQDSLAHASEAIIDQDTKVCTIVCQSEHAYIVDKNRSDWKNIYTIQFVESSLNEAANPNESDCLIKFLPNSTQVMLASLRSGVQFALYDQNGKLLYFRLLDACDPSNAVVSKDGYGHDYFSDVNDISQCTILTLDPSRYYIYTFYSDGGKKVCKSGKFIFTR